MDLSVVIPVYNLGDEVNALYRDLAGELEKMTFESEIIFVDDGSTDSTADELARIAEIDHRTKAVLLRNSAGAAEAAVYGLEASSGRFIVTMEPGFDPGDIIRFMLKLESGYDVVHGWRKTGLGSVRKGLGVKVANSMLSLITKVKIHDTGCNFRALKQRVVGSVDLHSDRYRFISVIAASKGARVGETEVTYDPEKAKVRARRPMNGWKVALDILQVKVLADFSTRPAWLFSLLSLPFWAAGLVFTGGFLFYEASDHALEGITIPGTGVLYLLLASSLSMFGFLSELIVKTGESKEALNNGD